MKKFGKFKLFGLLTFLSIALVFVGVNFLEADKPEKGKGGKPKPEPAFYRITMSMPDPEIDGMATDCISPEDGLASGYVLADWDGGHKFLHANGTLIDPDMGKKIPLLMGLYTNVEWARKYPDPDSGIFNGCYGENDYYHGALFIWFEKGKKRQPTIHFTWHFGYYTAQDVLENFTLGSEDISFPAWTGEGIEGRVNGLFDITYYLNDPDNRPSYISFTDGHTLELDFYLKIEKITQ